MNEAASDLYLQPPPSCDSPIHELHEIITQHPGCTMPGFYTLPNGDHVFHVCGGDDTTSVELDFISRGWTSRERPA